MQDVRHGAAYYSATPELEVKGSRYAPCAQGRFAAVADIGGHEVVDDQIECATEYQVGDTYFRADRLFRYQHESIAERQAIRQQALDKASGSNDGQVIPVLECEPFVYRRPSPRTLAQINPELVAASSSSLSRSSLSTLGESH